MKEEVIVFREALVFLIMKYRNTW